MKSSTSCRPPVKKRRANPRRAWKPAPIGALAALGLSLATAFPALATTYSITKVGNLGGSQSAAAAINESGQVVGTASLAERVEYNVGCSIRFRPCHTHPERPFLFSEGTITNLGSLEGWLFA